MVWGAVLGKQKGIAHRLHLAHQLHMGVPIITARSNWTRDTNANQISIQSDRADSSC